MTDSKSKEIKIHAYRFFYEPLFEIKESFGLIDWREMRVLYFARVDKDFPVVTKVMDFSTLLLRRRAKPETFIKCSLAKLPSFRAREPYMTRTGPLWMPPIVNSDYEQSIECYEDEVISRAFKELRDIVNDPRVVNLSERVKFVRTWFGPDVTIENNAIVFGEDRAKHAAFFESQMNQSIEAGKSIL